MAFDSARAERRHRRAQRLAAAAADLPTVGSTEALFGHRDAVLLMLAVLKGKFSSVTAQNL
ncbi:hypothetical protein QMK17_24245 [Rhodococcus sp. G-MC3]|uniref:hypothetical protein n=1 Tax=Rhodococcus sp. G-MC3 TaxID=3046209 RepID=UPI0024BA6F89|nr:hypothetical protein [Rhodococcus sp. G-MC3]MDJ0396420.1 hypothetical protein [Rhodococcus sp. G-MC3]